MGEFRDIWAKSQKEILKAKKINFVGYGLPKVDSDIRTILNPLHEKVKKGKVKIVCIVGPQSSKNSNNSTSDTWVEFLGEKIEIIEKTVKDYFS